MESLDANGWARLFGACRESACHLEMRDTYAVQEEAADFEEWRAGRWGPAEAAESWASWLDLMRKTSTRGVRLRRARIVSEPVTDYIRFEHEGTPLNIAAGEDVRWLPRTRASGLALPGNDFWIFDGATVLFNHFTGDGGWIGNELTTDPEVAKLCADAFESVWALAVPHSEYTLV
ncbi:DUF6879 family protein [Allonocardiopsis opalescens]|uniref:DUF6879 domain-containing protein n=1 Tax=Allonocardiopsis opalescens TaxID=1144618 RepID=A0A2T0Q052_9ACTN|nr:DUF6879 family protein [Allonocardiopsis opalescens]PRX97167.1 hypothetical protein CLV72_106203 [Allonocardiopsis opalescens]